MIKKFILILIALVAFTLFSGNISAPSSGPIASAEEPAIQTPPVQAAVQDTVQAYKAKRDPNLDTRPYKEMLRRIAEARGLPEEKIQEIIVTIEGNGHNEICPNGESGWNKNAVGDGGNSFGLVQINLPSHPNVTKEEAFDPEFSLTFIVDQFSRGNEWMWTCWRAVYDR